MYRRQGYKIGSTLFWLAVLLVFVNSIPIAMGGSFNFNTFGISGGILALFGLLLWRVYWRKDQQDVSASYMDWAWLFFWALITHPLLDSCTVYGTQLFQPFSDYRVALNNIAVADPAYTFPFILCLLIALFISRHKKSRRFFTWLGIILSSAYLLFGFYHKWQMDKIFAESLEREKIEYERYMTSPTILNNFLWTGVAEGDDAFYFGMYSFFDPEPKVTSFERVAKNHHLLEDHENDRDIRILKWFSKDYFSLLERDDGTLQFNDLRYGAFNGQFDGPESYIFRFDIDREGPIWKAGQSPPPDRFDQEQVQRFFARIKGEAQ